MWRPFPQAIAGLFLVLNLSACGSAGGSGPGSPWSDAVVRSGLLEATGHGSEASGPLFQRDQPLVFTLEADIHQLRYDRSQESEERPGRVVLGVSGEGDSFPVEVRTRGNFRLQPHICSFPPLRLDFPTDSIQGSVLEGLNKVKLVTHCGSRDYYEQNILEEYLAYRIFNLLTDISFRVQLAAITYVDTSGRDSPISRLAFLIEDEDAVAERLGGEVLEAPRASPNNFQPYQAGLVYLFQYLIGNTDWSLVRFHNVKLLRVGYDFIPLPYDFDFAGFVYTPYADPAPKLIREIQDVRDRLYRGFCSDGIDYQELFSHFEEVKEPILDLIRSQPALDEGNARRAMEYVDSFYEIIEDPGRAQREIVEACREIRG